MYRITTHAIVCAVGLLILNASWADETEEPPTPTTIEALEELIENVLEKYDVPAVGIALVDESGPVWVTALGTADLATDTNVDSNAMFRIGSTSKMFVALAVLKLVEEGRLSLTDKIVDLAPEIEFVNQWADTDPIRIVHLLEHTTGWDDIHLIEYGHNDPTPITLREGLDFHPHSRVSRWKPGSRMSYCNSGPPVAAYIIEKVTGRDFEQYVRENFFLPLGMETATYRLNADVEKKGVTLYDTSNTPQDYWHILLRPSGSINASSLDMQKMVSFFVDRGVAGDERIISLQSLERMEHVGSTPAAAVGQTSGYGLNNYSSVYENWVYRGHNGGVNGGLTELAYLPAEKLGYVFMINSGNVQAYSEISNLIRSFQTHALQAPIVAAGDKVTAEHLALTGYYAPVNSRQEQGYFMDRILGVQKIWFDGNQLQRKALMGGETSAYFASSPILYRSAETGATALSYVNDPLLGPVVHANTLVMKEVSPLLVFTQLGIAVLWVLSMVASIAFFLVWGVRRLRGKISPGPAIRIRVWPLLASLSIVLFVWMLALGLQDPFTKLGAPTLVSVTLMIATLVFAAFAVVGVRSAAVFRNTSMNRGTYWFSTASSILHLVVVGYLLYFGVIGIKIWA